MRAHGVPHPLPDKKGDFHLTRADERHMRAVPEKQRKAADDACFHNLKGLNLKPLSKRALARANRVIASLGRCIERAGFQVGVPEAKNLGRGRASFGLKPLPGMRRLSPREVRRYTKVELSCEKRVHFPQRLTRIINEDRKDSLPANL